jgi:hypothetical protein
MKRTSGGLFAELDRILGKPLLLKSDDPDQYRALEQEFERILKPRDFIEALKVRDIVNATWESARFKTHAAALVNAEWGKALKKLASPGSGYVSDRVAKLVDAYLAGPQHDGMAEWSMLEKSGLSASAVEAHAVLLAGDNLSVLEELVSRRDATRNALLEANRKERAAKEKRQAVKEKKRAAKEKNDWKD